MNIYSSRLRAIFCENALLVNGTQMKEKERMRTSKILVA